MRRSEVFAGKIENLLNCIQVKFQLKPEDFLKAMTLTEAEYQEILMGRRSYSLVHLLSLANALGLSIDLLLTGTLDVDAAARRYAGERHIFPSRYSKSAQALIRARAMRVAICYLDTHVGRMSTDAILERLQVYRDQFDDTAKFISPLIFFDLLEVLGQSGYTDAHFRMLGTMTLVVEENKIGRLLKSASSPRELYKSVCDLLMGQYDRLSLYLPQKLTMTDLVLKVLPSEEGKDAFHANVIGNRGSCLYRQGVAMSFLANILPAYAEVHESRCVHVGDSHCLYHVNWAV